LNTRIVTLAARASHDSILSSLARVVHPERSPHPPAMSTHLAAAGNPLRFWGAG
jgi:hypothetical protein